MDVQASLPQPATVATNDAPAARRRSDSTGLVAEIVAATDVASRPEGDRLQQFLDQRESAEAILQWLGGKFSGSREALARRLNQDIAVIDRLLNAQLNAVLHAAA